MGFLREKLDNDFAGLLSPIVCSAQKHPQVRQLQHHCALVLERLSGGEDAEKRMQARLAGIEFGGPPTSSGAHHRLGRWDASGQVLQEVPESVGVLVRAGFVYRDDVKVMEALAGALCNLGAFGCFRGLKSPPPLLPHPP